MDHIFSSKRSCFPGCAAEWTQTSNALASNLCILSVFSLFIFIKTILGINISIIHKASPSADSADKDFPLSLFSASVNLMGTGATPPKVILKSARFPDVPKKAYAKVISCSKTHPLTKSPLLGISRQTMSSSGFNCSHGLTRAK